MSMCVEGSKEARVKDDSKVCGWALEEVSGVD